jgi:hypothetical protein
MSDNNSDFETVEVVRNYNNYDCALYGCDADLIKIRLWEDDSDYAPSEVVRICDDPDCDFHIREVQEGTGVWSATEISGFDSGTHGRNPNVVDWTVE